MHHFSHHFSISSFDSMKTKRCFTVIMAITVIFVVLYFAIINDHRYSSSDCQSDNCGYSTLDLPFGNRALRRTILTNQSLRASDHDPTKTDMDGNSFSKLQDELPVQRNHHVPVLVDRPFQNHTSMFTFTKEFVFPHATAFRPTQILQQADWMNHLKGILSQWKGKREVVLTSASSSYREVLLNWLISAVIINANVTLEKVLVISYDEPIHFLMTSKEIQSIQVIPSSLFMKPQHVSPLNQVWMTRLVVMRLLNHWGFHIFHYDTDALLIRDPSPLFKLHNDSGIIASMGKYPYDLGAKWGATLCTGMIVIKSSKQTEEYWQAVSTVNRKSFSDQERLNYGLQSLQITWQSGKEVFTKGYCRNGLEVTLLPHSYVCRSDCKRSKIKSYYIWHKTGHKDGQSKRHSASAGNLWYLRTDWMSSCELDYVGRDWLNCITSNVNE